MEFLLILFPYWNNEKGNKLTFLPSWKLESLVLPQRCRFMILDRQKWGGSHLLMLSCWQVTFLRQVSLWCTFQCLVKTSQIRGSWVRAAEAGVIAFPDRSYSGYHLEFSNPAYVSDFYSYLYFTDIFQIFLIFLTTCWHLISGGHNWSWHLLSLVWSFTVSIKQWVVIVNGLW